jgi:hypothetical protein
MMIYFSTKKDLEFLKQFKKDAEDMIDIEERMEIGSYTMITPMEARGIRRDRASVVEGYLEIREQIARNVIRAIGLANKMGIPLVLHSYPAAAIGGPVIPINIFQAILNDNSHGGIEKQHIIDTLNQTIGQYERLDEKEFWQMVNPLYWLKMLALTIIRLPYTILKLSGFDVSKIEQDIWGKAMSLAWIVAVIYILISYGFDHQQVLNVILNRGK